VLEHAGAYVFYPSIRGLLNAPEFVRFLQFRQVCVSSVCCSVVQNVVACCSMRPSSCASCKSARCVFRQCAAACCSVVQCVAVCCIVMQCVAQCIRVRVRPARPTGVCCFSPLQSGDSTATSRCTHHCNTLQHTATHCNTLQHTATHCNTLQHTATHCNTLH